MSRADRITLWVAALSFVIVGAFAAHRTTGLQLISMPVMLVFFGACIVSIVRVFTRWSARRWRALIPLAACFASIIAIGAVGRVARDIVFAWALPSYQRVIDDIESDRIVVSGAGRTIPEAIAAARLTYAVIASRAPNGALSVEFLTESGFPAKHSGYLYSSSGIDDSFVRSRWPRMSRLRDHWFYVSD
jgi:hypothetical protein